MIVLLSGSYDNPTREIPTSVFYQFGLILVKNMRIGWNGTIFHYRIIKNRYARLESEVTIEESAYLIEKEIYGN